MFDPRIRYEAVYRHVVRRLHVIIVSATEIRLKKEQIKHLNILHLSFFLISNLKMSIRIAINRSHIRTNRPPVAIIRIEERIRRWDVFPTIISCRLRIILLGNTLYMR